MKKWTREQRIRGERKRAKALRRQARTEAGVKNYSAADPRHPAHPDHINHMRWLKVLKIIRLSLRPGESWMSLIAHLGQGQPEAAPVPDKKLPEFVPQLHDHLRMTHFSLPKGGTNALRQLRKQPDEEGS